MTVHESAEAAAGPGLATPSAPAAAAAVDGPALADGPAGGPLVDGAAGALAIVVAGGLAVAVAGTAQAAVGGRWGFAFVDNPAVPGVPDLAHQAGSWPPGFVVHSKPAPGARVIVTFPRIASRGGVVLVTAVVDVPVWCQALNWARSGPNEVVVFGVLADGRFLRPAFTERVQLYYCNYCESPTMKSGYHLAGRRSAAGRWGACQLMRPGRHPQSRRPWSRR